MRAIEPGICYDNGHGTLVLERTRGQQGEHISAGERTVPRERRVARHEIEPGSPGEGKLQLTDGQILVLCRGIRRPGRHAEVLDQSRPENAGLALAHAIEIRLVVGIRAQRDSLAEIVVRADGAKAVRAPELGVGRGLALREQGAQLDGLRVDCDAWSHCATRALPAAQTAGPASESHARVQARGTRMHRLHHDCANPMCRSDARQCPQAREMVRISLRGCVATEPFRWRLFACEEISREGVQSDPLTPTKRVRSLPHTILI